MNNYIERRILEGEHQQQDFKYAINDSKKIARSLSAFSNTDGGRLLIGVKDNGSVVGVSSDEEYYMVEAAAAMYCRPEVAFDSRSWEVEGKTVLEITVPRCDKPIAAPAKNGRWMAFIRVADQNLLANSIWLRVKKRQQAEQPVLIQYTEAERALLNYLKRHPAITLSKFCRVAHITRRNAERILVDLISVRIVLMDFTEKRVYYRLNPAHDLSDTWQDIIE